MESRTEDPSRHAEQRMTFRESLEHISQDHIDTMILRVAKYFYKASQSDPTTKPRSSDKELYFYVDLAKDAMQEVMTRGVDDALTSGSTEMTNLEGYLFKAIKHRMLDLLKRDHTRTLSGQTVNTTDDNISMATFAKEPQMAPDYLGETPATVFERNEKHDVVAGVIRTIDRQLQEQAADTPKALREKRELHILQLHLLGRSNIEIAQELFSEDSPYKSINNTYDLDVQADVLKCSDSISKIIARAKEKIAATVNVKQ